MTEYENRAEDYERSAAEWAGADDHGNALTAAVLAISARLADLTDAVRSVQQ